MMHGRTIGPQGRETERWRRWRLLLALLVMLAAVLPHLTLSVSSATSLDGSRGALPVQTYDGAAPCHESPSDTRHQTAAACCVIGCALVAELHEPASPVRMTAWSRLRPAEAAMLAGISREPAKPPPRPEPAGS